MVVVAVLYLGKMIQTPISLNDLTFIGFLTTFSLLARDRFKISEMSWILVKVFFGSSYLGFDIMTEINPILGPPLMLIFVTLTNILLITSLISILSDSFSKVIAHAREEYLFVYSVYVLEASTSNRLTHFYPPLNLIPLILIRPLRLFFPSEKLRAARIILLKVTHAPIVGAIWVFEKVFDHIGTGAATFSSHGPGLAQLTSDDVSPSKKQRPFLSNRTNSKISSGHFPAYLSEDGFGGPTTQHQGKENGGPAGGSNSDLEAKVTDLSNKIAELTALIMAQQAPAPEI